MTENLNQAPTRNTNSYRELFSNRGFLVLWSSTATLNLATTMANLTLGVLVHRSTGSAFLSAAAMFGPSLAAAVGGLTTMSVADSWRPKPVLGWTALAIASLILLQAAPVPVGVRILLAFVTAFVLSISLGARYGALSDLVDKNEYSLGRSAINIAVGVTQMIGFTLGALLLFTGIDVGIFVIAAMLSLAASASTFLFPPLPARRTNSPGLRETIAANKTLLAIPGTRPLMIALVVPNGLIVGCEALFVAFEDTNAGPGVLFTAGAFGMLVGDIVVGRYMTLNGRLRASHVLRFTLAVPFLAFALSPPLWVCALLVAVATAGYGASLFQQEVLNWLAPREIAGQALGFEAAMRTTGQGLFALIAGGLGDLLTPPIAILVLAIASILVSAMLTRGLRAGDSRYAQAYA